MYLSLINILVQCEPLNTDQKFGLQKLETVLLYGVDILTDDIFSESTRQTDRRTNGQICDRKCAP